MAGGKTDILIYVEDPGAANTVVDLPRALAKRGLGSLTFAAGHAAPYLKSLGADFTGVGESEDAAALIGAHGPRLVMAGTSENPDTLGLKLIEAARRRSIVAVSFVDAPGSAEYRFRGRGHDPLGFAPDWLLAPDDATAGRFRALGFNAHRVVNCGHPHFDRVREMGRALRRRGRAAVRAGVLPDSPDDRPVVVFLAEISGGLIPAAFERGDDYTLAGRGASDRRTDIVLEEFLDAIALVRPRPYIVLRLHPKNQAREFAAYRPEIDVVSQGGSPLELVFAADLVVGMTTTLLFESALIGVPTLSVVPRPLEVEWLTATALGIVPSVNTREALRDILPTAVANPSRLMARPADKVIHFGALDRMADFLSCLLAGGAVGSKAGGNN